MKKILSEETSDMVIDENEIQERINTLIKENKSFRFEAGAGSGKTYGLKESLKYILENYSEELINKNQKILSITYTNTAKDEISKELERNSLAQINTIHEFVWETISSHQNLLFNEHAYKIKKELKKIDQGITELAILSKEKLKEISVLEEDDYENIIDVINTEKFKKAHYLNLESNANDYREAIKKAGWIWDLKKGPLKNYSNFRKFVTKYYKKIELTNVKKDMIKNKFKKIKYAHYTNKDQLHRYKISHDTVLEYGYNIVKKYPLIQQKIIDSYPYILIDEYQDTNTDVIKLLKVLFETSKERSINQVLGFFGDSIQSIYSKGVGETIEKYFSNIKSVEKEINRRSCQKIINVSNNIRNDGHVQESIYEDANCGKVSIEILKEGDIKDFISNEFDSFEKYEITNNSQGIKKMVMMTKHADLAKICGFGDFYRLISSFSYFKGANYHRLNSEFLTKEDKDLNNFLRVLNEIIILHTIDDKTMLSKIINYDKSLKNITYLKAMDIIMTLKNIKQASEKKNLKELLELIFEESNKNPYIKKIYKKIIPIDELNMENFKIYMNKNLISQGNENNLKSEGIINDLLQISFININNWFKYRKEDYKPNEINYSTMHNSKGTEFDNVILVLNDSFSNRKDYFSYFFENYDKPKKTEKFIEARNLLYVACSRARVNLTLVIPKEIYDKNQSVIDQIFEKNPAEYKV